MHDVRYKRQAVNDDGNLSCCSTPTPDEATKKLWPVCSFRSLAKSGGLLLRLDSAACLLASLGGLFDFLCVYTHIVRERERGGGLDVNRHGVETRI